MLTTIALPHDWCNYGAVIEGFKAKYGLEVNELNPNAGSGDEIEAIKANKDNTGPQAPDVIDVDASFLYEVNMFFLFFREIFYNLTYFVC
jgi:putative spermidine/putrescine transport system substrate-binding protein